MNYSSFHEVKITYEFHADQFFSQSVPASRRDRGRRKQDGERGMTHEHVRRWKRPCHVCGTAAEMPARDLSSVTCLATDDYFPFVLLLRLRLNEYRCLKLLRREAHVRKNGVFAIARSRRGISWLPSIGLPSRRASIPLRRTLRSSVTTTKIMRCNEDGNVARRCTKHLRARGPIVINTLPENTLLLH